MIALIGKPSRLEAFDEHDHIGYAAEARSSGREDNARQALADRGAITITDQRPLILTAIRNRVWERSLRHMEPKSEMTVETATPFFTREGAELYHGDCLSVLPTLPTESVDSVVTDPPYFLPATHYNTRSGSAKSLSDLSILEHFFASFFSAVRRVLKPDGFLYAFCDGQSYPVFYATAYRHFKKLRPLVWDKGTSINGYSWRHQHELILFAESDGSRAVPTGDGDVLKCKAVPIKERAHLAEKPVDLVGRLIAKTTPAGGVVLDPFAGSATTGEAALKHGYRFIGIERDDGYVTIAKDRLAGLSFHTGAA